MTPPVAQPRVLSCYVLQQARPIEVHKALTLHYLIGDLHMRVNKIFETAAFCIQKQAPTVDHLGIILLQTSSKEMARRVLRREKQTQNFWKIRPAVLLTASTTLTKGCTLVYNELNRKNKYDIP